jgi:hypothetical protein
MAHTHRLESTIQQRLGQAGTCSPDELVMVLPGYFWDQVFAAVDRLTRQVAVTLWHPSSLRYLLTLAPSQSIEGRYRGRPESD